MEVFVKAAVVNFSNWTFPEDSVVGDLLTRFVQRQGVGSSQDFYVVRNGRLVVRDEPLQHGAVYHLETRLCGGKGGFGSMLRALGAQIEKTTNREACRDLSGRRLRDVNHEKEMAEWLKKQAEREAEKEQRRLERLQRKLQEPKHQFSDPEYQQQCHNLSERLEDSVIKGLQVSSSGQVKTDDTSATKRPSSDHSEQPHKKKMMMMMGACFWSGLDEVPSSEEEDDEESSSSSSCGAAITMTTQMEEAEPEPSSSSADQNQPTDQHEAPGPCTGQTVRSSEELGAPGPCRDQTVRSADCEPSGLQHGRPELDLFSVSSVDQLEALGLDALKEELMRRGVKCGGTLTERAARLFSVRGLTPDQIEPALLAKPVKARRK